MLLYFYCAMIYCLGLSFWNTIQYTITGETMPLKTTLLLLLPVLIGVFVIAIIGLREEVKEGRESRNASKKEAEGIGTVEFQLRQENARLWEKLQETIDKRKKI